MSSTPTIKSDRQGFLLGESLDGDNLERLLEGVKGDTSRILALLRRTSGAPSRANPAVDAERARASATPPGRARAAQAGTVGPGVAPRRTATPPARSERNAGDKQAREYARGADGRFISRASVGQAASREGRAVIDVARSAEQVARTAEARRRDEKADARRNQARDAGGRFSGGGDGTVGGPAAGIAGRLASGIRGAASVVEGADRIDPIIGAATEVREAVAPLGRAAMSVLGHTKDESVPWLRKLWREFRALRREEAAAARATQRGLKDVQDAAAASRAGGGGLLSGLSGLAAAIPGIAGLGKMLGLAGQAVVGTTAAVGRAARGVLPAGASGGMKGLLTRLPVVGALIEAITAVIEDQRIAADASLSDDMKTRRRFENAGSSLGVLSGAAGGAAIGTAVAPGIGTVAGGVLGALGGSSAGRRVGGWVSRFFESGRKGASAISTGRGDFGGASYGAHQLSSRTGTLQQFLGSSGYAQQFAGLAPGSAEFNARWTGLARNDPRFAAAQHDFIERTHFQPQMQRLKAAGLDLSGRGEAVREAVFSTATQFGPNTSVIERALAGRNLAGMSDADVVAAVQDYKIANNASLFRSSSEQTQQAQLGRAAREKAVLLSIAQQAGRSAPSVPAGALGAASAGPSGTTATARPPTAAPVASPAVTVATMPSPVSIPKVQAPSQLPAAPTLEVASARVLNTSAPPAGAPQPPAPVGQDVRDRTIAHIVTGGIGGVIAHR